MPKDFLKRKSTQKQLLQKQKKKSSSPKQPISQLRRSKTTPFEPDNKADSIVPQDPFNLFFGFDSEPGKDDSDALNEKIP